MVWVCTAATAAWYLGSWPVPGKVYVIPESRLAGYSADDKKEAQRCARKLRIRYWIARGR